MQNEMRELFAAWKEEKTGWCIQIWSRKDFLLVKSKGVRHHCEWNGSVLRMDGRVVAVVKGIPDLTQILKENLSL